MPEFEDNKLTPADEVKIGSAKKQGSILRKDNAKYKFNPALIKKKRSGFSFSMGNREPPGGNAVPGVNPEPIKEVVKVEETKKEQSEDEE